MGVHSLLQKEPAEGDCGGRSPAPGMLAWLCVYEAAFVPNGAHVSNLSTQRGASNWYEVAS